MSDILSPGEIIKPTVNQVDILDVHISQLIIYLFSTGSSWSTAPVTVQPDTKQRQGVQQL